MSLLTEDTTGGGGPADPGPVSAPHRSRAERPTSYRVADFPVPTGREEEWRFTPLNRLADLFTDRPPGAHLARGTDLPAGADLSELDPAQVRALDLPAPGDRAAAVTLARSGGALRLDLGEEARPDAPIRVRLTGTGPGTTHDHLVITAGRFSRGTVILDHDGSGEHSELVSVHAADGAELTVVTVQEWAGDAVHLSQQDLIIGRDARIRHVAVTFGGALVRVSTNVRHSGPGGSFEGFGVYFADPGQHLEHRLFVDHAVPHCTSRVEYRGALQGETARTVWVGDVLIRADAEATDTYELNRNLVLTDGARADSVPNLEIETGEIVGAGHASATGRFDDEQMFYLQARGIPAEEARRLVVRGFFAGLITRIGVPDLQDRLLAGLDAELASVPGTVGGTDA
jgi:Fe-S cluster assembly protein SufD